MAKATATRASKKEIPPFTKTIKQVIDEISASFTPDTRVTYFKVDARTEFSRRILSYNEREVNEKLLAEKNKET